MNNETLGSNSTITLGQRAIFFLNLSCFCDITGIKNIIIQRVRPNRKYNVAEMSAPATSIKVISRCPNISNCTSTAAKVFLYRISFAEKLRKDLLFQVALKLYVVSVCKLANKCITFTQSFTLAKIFSATY